MNIYFACLAFESDVDGDSAGGLVEESVVLIYAADRAHAAAKAAALGPAREHSYLNDAGETVTWRFAGVVNVQAFCEPALTDGAEVYSRMDWTAGAPPEE